MAALAQINAARTQFLDGNGAPLVGGTVATYIPGTTTGVSTFQDSNGTTNNTNPITLDSLGSASIWYYGQVRMIVKDVNGNQIYDQVCGDSGIGKDSAYYPSVIINDTSSATRSANQAAIQASCNAAYAAGGGLVQLPAGAIHTSGTITVHDNVNIKGKGRGSTFVAPNNTTQDVFFFTPSGTNANTQRGGMSDLTIYHDAEPSAGSMVHLDRVYHASFHDMEITGGYIGLWLDSAVHNYFSDVDIAADSRFTTAHSGSALCKISKGSGAIPAENHFVNCDWRGEATDARQGYLDYSVLISDCDGTWFANCHFGFCNIAALALNPGTTTSQLTGVYTENCYLDTVLGTCLVAYEPTGYTGAFGGHNLKFVTVYNALSGCLWKVATTFDCWIRGGLWTTFGTHGIQITKGQNIHISDLTIANLNGTNVTGTGVLLDGGANCVGIDILNVGVKKGSGAYMPTAAVTTTAGCANVTVRGLYCNLCTNDIIRADSDSNSLYEIYASDRLFPSVSANVSGALFLAPGYNSYLLGTANGVTSISSISFKGQQVDLVAQGAVTVTSGNNLNLNGNFSMTNGSVLRLKSFDGTKFTEVSRSAA